MITRSTTIAAVAIAAVLGAGTAACSSAGQGTAYRPAAYGVQVGSVYDCYFVDDIGEVTDLVRAGLCPANSVATVMPISWEEEYWSYYSSTAYVNTYMPSQYRNHFDSVTVVTFSSRYKSQITTASAHAVYSPVGGGKTVTGTSKLKFGTSSGSSGTSGGSSSVHGGGSVRCAKSLDMTTVQEKSGTSGSGSTHGGGSARSGGSSSSSGKSSTKTSTGSGSLGGC
jgi:hypothetical protein